MCIVRKIEECVYGSTVTIDERYYIISAATIAHIESLCMVVIIDKETKQTKAIPFGTIVTSHYLTPIERRRLGPSMCEVVAEDL